MIPGRHGTVMNSAIRGVTNEIRIRRRVRPNGQKISHRAATSLETNLTLAERNQMSLTKSTSETGVGTDEGDNIFRHGRNVQHGYELPDWWILESEKRHLAERQAEEERLQVVNAS